ncbi:MAG: acyl-CoA dehydrogenase family protein [Gemmatimonadota bacterium]
MNFLQRQLRDTAREFAQRELEPHAERWDRERAFPREAVARLGELGFLALLVPEEEGGSGFDSVGFCLAIEEVSRAVPALGLLLSVHNGPVTHILRKARSPTARDRWLPRIGTGEALGAWALHERDAGSDAGAIETILAPCAEGFRLRGAKAWVSGAGVADLAVVFARAAGGDGSDGADGARGGWTPRTSDGDGLPAAGPAGVRAVLLDLGGPGVHVGEPEETMGLRALPLAGVELADAPVAADAVLLDEAATPRVAAEAEALGRLGAAALSLGIAGRCIDEAVGYAADRRAFGRPISEFQGVRLPLAELAARLEAARALAHRTAVALDRILGLGAEGDGETGTPRVNEVEMHASMAKLLASDLAMAAALQAVQTHGGYGYIKEYPVERFFRDAKACQLYEGTNELQRVVIAQRLFGG